MLFRIVIICRVVHEYIFVYTNDFEKNIYKIIDSNLIWGGNYVDILSHIFCFGII